jgi:hypothetical protein
MIRRERDRPRNQGPGETLGAGGAERFGHRQGRTERRSRGSSGVKLDDQPKPRANGRHDDEDPDE